MRNVKSLPVAVHFSLLKHDIEVGKIFTKNPDGTLQGETNGRLESAMSFCKTISSIHEIKTLIESSTGHEHIVTGVTGHDAPVGVYPGAKVQGSVARDNKHYKQPKGNGLLIIDSDNITESIYPELIQVCPELGNVASLETTSSSSLIYDATGWLKPFGGTHTYFAIKDAKDVKRTLNVLHKRAILMGFDKHRVSAVGGFLERSWVDTMLDKPSQPIYLKPNLGPGLFQDKKFVERPGEPLFDSRKFIRDLTEAEEDEYQGLIEYSRFAMQDECNRVRAEWIARQPNPQTAEKALQTKTLDGAFVIHTAHYGSVTVHDILMDPAKYHGQTCRDPFYDGDYNSKTIAKIFTMQNVPMINSHAHGGVTYRLLDPTMVGFGAERVPVSDLYPNLTLGGDIPEIKPDQVIPQQPVIELNQPVNSTVPEINPVQPTDIDVPRAAYGLSEPIERSTWYVPHCSDQGAPRMTFDIFKFMLTQYGISIGYDVIGKKCLMLGQGIHVNGDLKANANHARIEHLCEMNQLKTSRNDGYISMLMADNEVNPVTNWVGSKPWDGEHRIRPLFDTLNVKENDMSYLLFVKWLCGSLRLAKGEIERFEHVLVLQASKGGEGKSRWFNKLTRPELNNSMSLRLDDKDQLKEAVSYWIVELGELDSTFQKSEIKALMGFLSKDKDNIRLPYAKANNEYQRRTSFAGTVNNRNFLIDDSGDRRFWILETGDINYEHNIDMQQVWAEIDTMTDQEWLTREQNDSIIEINKGFKMEDPLTDMLESYFSRPIISEGTRHINATQILKNAGIINPSKAHVNKCSRWLRARGYDYVTQRTNGIALKGFNIPYFNEMLL